MVTIQGVDYAWSHPGGKALAAAGKRFAARYLSTDADKNITRAEADDLAAHGVSSVVVWETTAKRPLSGRAAGISDAQAAQRQATAAGMPSGRPIYFAVDFDAQPSQMPTVMAYLDGAASVLGKARVGVYGGYDVVRAALDGKHAAWGWQTRAWSEGHWEPRARIRQGTTQTIGGVSCDLNTATAEDYGQWTPGQTPHTSEEDDMPSTEEFWGYRNAKAGDKHDMHQALVNAETNSAKAYAATVANTAAITALAKALGDAHDGVDTATVVAAVTEAVDNAVEKAVVKVDVSVGDNTTSRENPTS
jgi:hypothetical protein